MANSRIKFLGTSSVAAGKCLTVADMPKAIFSIPPMRLELEC
jgi:hypothetical protein